MIKQRTCHFVIPRQGTVDNLGKTLLDTGGKLVVVGRVARCSWPVQIFHLNHLKYESQRGCIHHLHCRLQIDFCCWHCKWIDCKKEKVWIMEIDIVVLWDKVDYDAFSFLVNFEELVIIEGIAPSQHGHGHVWSPELGVRDWKVPHNVGKIALGGLNYHLIDAKSLVFNAVFKPLCIICFSTVVLVMTNGHDRGRIWFPHLRTNCDGWGLQWGFLLHKLFHRYLTVKEPFDAREAKAKEAYAEQREEECQF